MNHQSFLLLFGVPVNLKIALVLTWLCKQSLRRAFTEKDMKQGFNALKYFSTIVALVMRTQYELVRANPSAGGSMTWKLLAAATSGVTTIYNTYWDIVIDWGLLRRNSNNPWLRDKLLLASKPVYFVAMVKRKKYSIIFSFYILSKNWTVITDIYIYVDRWWMWFWGLYGCNWFLIFKKRHSSTGEL